jgi:hypothetical protein
VRQGAEAMGATVVDFGLLTTPQLHHVVRMANIGGDVAAKWASEDGYYRMLAEAYGNILQVRFTCARETRVCVCTCACVSMCV